MEQIDYKKKYEEALDNFKKIKSANKDNKALVDFIEYEYPELKESEDEKIRKELIEFVNQYGDKFYGQITKASTIAWLEKKGDKPHEEKVDEAMREIEEKAKAFSDKHKGESGDDILAQMRGEQITNDKIEPKFHAGDFITDGERIFQIKETIWERNNRNDGTTYCESLIVSLRDGITYANNTDLKEYHLWTTQDAKDGDVLVDSYGNVCIYQGLSTVLMYHSYCYAYNKGFIELGGSHYISNTYPATTEQCNFLFSKMKEAGYEWNVEKKELRKIEQKPAEWEYSFGKNTTFDNLIGIAECLEMDGDCSFNGMSGTDCGKFLRELARRESVEQNPAWSENAKRMFIKALERVEEQNNKGYKLTDCDKNSWWEDFKAYCGYIEMQRSTWSEEDEIAWNNTIIMIKECAANHYTKDSINLVITWLKSLKNRVKPQQKSAWSEEDEKEFKWICVKLQEHHMSLEYTERVRKAMSWLKSLKERVQPQSNWKPSEEMLEALYKAVPDNVKEMSEDEMLLDKLYQGLKYGKVLSEN